MEANHKRYDCYTSSVMGTLPSPLCSGIFFICLFSGHPKLFLYYTLLWNVEHCSSRTVSSKNSYLLVHQVELFLPPLKLKPGPVAPVTTEATKATLPPACSAARCKPTVQCNCICISVPGSPVKAPVLVKGRGLWLTPAKPAGLVTNLLWELVV